MEEFLPSNKTIQALENPVSIQEAIAGALQQLKQSNKKVVDIFTWISGFSSYISNGCKTSSAFNL